MLPSLVSQELVEELPELLLSVVGGERTIRIDN